MGCQLTLMLQFGPLIVALAWATGDVFRPTLLESAAVVRGICFEIVEQSLLGGVIPPSRVWFP
jgi:hypothetical protein